MCKPACTATALTAARRLCYSIGYGLNSADRSTMRLRTSCLRHGMWWLRRYDAELHKPCQLGASDLNASLRAHWAVSMPVLPPGVLLLTMQCEDSSWLLPRLVHMLPFLSAKYMSSVGWAARQVAARRGARRAGGTRTRAADALVLEVQHIDLLS